MNGRKARWEERWMEGWMDEQMGRRMNGMHGEFKESQMGREMDGRMDVDRVTDNNNKLHLYSA